LDRLILRCLKRWPLPRRADCPDDIDRQLIIEVNLTQITPDTIRNWKGTRQISALTAYDFPTARLLDEAGIDLILAIRLE
jgi:hypothetical protein